MTREFCANSQNFLEDEAEVPDEKASEEMPTEIHRSIPDPEAVESAGEPVPDVDEEYGMSNDEPPTETDLRSGQFNFDATGSQKQSPMLMPSREEVDHSREIIREANHLAEGNEWGDDLSARQREEEDQAIIREWIDKQVQKNKWIHFSNQANEGRFIKDSRPERTDNTMGQIRPMNYRGSLYRDGKEQFDSVEGAEISNFTRYAGYEPIHDEFQEFIPDTYYHPNKPLPIFRNHEALTTMDSRDPRYIPPGKNQDEDPADVLKVGMKQSKLDQMNTGVAYSPDFDFELWSEDYHRPRKPKDWPDEFRNKKQAQEYYSLKFGGTLPGPKMPTERMFKALPAAEPALKDSFVREDRHSKLLKFTWRGKMTRNIYQTSKKPTFHGVIIVGNGAGAAGLGFGRAKSYREALTKAEEQARHNMIYMPRYKDGQLAHQLVGKCNSVKVVIKPMPPGRGETAPAIIRAVCTAFGVRDYTGYFDIRKRNKFTQIRAIWDCFLQATNPSQAVEDRGVRLVETVPEVDGASYHLPVGFAHNNRRDALKILDDHFNKWDEKEQLSKYKLTDEQKSSLPAWLSDCRDPFWERKYKGEPDMFLNEYGNRTLQDDELEMQALQMLEPGIDPAAGNRARELQRQDV